MRNDDLTLTNPSHATSLSQSHQRTKHAFRTGDESDDDGAHMSTLVSETTLQHEPFDGLDPVHWGGFIEEDSQAVRGGGTRPERVQRGRGRGRGGGRSDTKTEMQGSDTQQHYISGHHDQLKPAPAPRGNSARGPRQQRGPRIPAADEPMMGRPEDYVEGARDAGGHPRGRSDRSGSGRGGRGGGRGRGGRDAGSDPKVLAESLQPKLLMRPASAMHSASEHVVDYRAVPGPTVGAASGRGRPCAPQVGVALARFMFQTPLSGALNALIRCG